MRVAALLAAAVVLTRRRRRAVRLRPGPRSAGARPAVPGPARDRSRRRTAATTAAASATCSRRARAATTTPSSSPRSSRTGRTVPHCCDQLGDVRRPRLRDAGAEGRPTSAATSRTRRSASRPRTSSAATRRAPTSRSCATRAVRRPARLRRDARRRDVRRSATRARRTGCSSWTCCATPGAASSRASPAAPNAAQDAEQWAVAPYTEADLQRQADQLDDVLGPAGAVIQRDVEHYIAGVNQYIAEAQARPAKLPGEYVAIGRPQGPGAVEARPTCSRPPRSSAASSARAAARSCEFVRDPPGAARPLRHARAARACSATSARRRIPRRR